MYNRRGGWTREGNKVDNWLREGAEVVDTALPSNISLATLIEALKLSPSLNPSLNHLPHRDSAC